MVKLVSIYLHVESLIERVPLCLFVSLCLFQTSFSRSCFSFQQRFFVFFCCVIGMTFDVVPRTISLETLGGRCVPLVTRNSWVPFRKRLMFGKTNTTTQTIAFRFFSGERMFCSENRLITEKRLDLSLYSSFPLERLDIEVTIDVASSGVVVAHIDVPRFEMDPLLVNISCPSGCVDDRSAPDDLDFDADLQRFFDLNFRSAPGPPILPFHEFHISYPCFRDGYTHCEANDQARLVLIDMMKQFRREIPWYVVASIHWAFQGRIRKDAIESALKYFVDSPSPNVEFEN